MKTENTNTPLGERGNKFSEWLTLKKYSPATIATTVRIMKLFATWAESESITELTEISYQDAMSFMQWSSKQEPHKRQ